MTYGAIALDDEPPGLSGVAHTVRIEFVEQRIEGVPAVGVQFEDDADLWGVLLVDFDETAAIRAAVSLAVGGLADEEP